MRWLRVVVVATVLVAGCDGGSRESEAVSSPAPPSSVGDAGVASEVSGPVSVNEGSDFDVSDDEQAFSEMSVDGERDDEGDCGTGACPSGPDQTDAAYDSSSPVESGGKRDAGAALAGAGGSGSTASDDSAGVESKFDAGLTANDGTTTNATDVTETDPAEGGGCPLQPPTMGDECIGEGQACTYYDCAGVGQVRARCTEQRFVVETTACEAATCESRLFDQLECVAAGLCVDTYTPSGDGGHSVLSCVEPCDGAMEDCLCRAACPDITCYYTPELGAQCEVPACEFGCP